MSQTQRQLFEDRDQRGPLLVLKGPYAAVHPVPEWALPIDHHEECPFVPRRVAEAERERRAQEQQLDVDAEYRSIVG